MMDDLTDIDGLRYHDRLHHHLDNLGGKDPRNRAEIYDLAHSCAVGEMLDEIHLMLRHATGIERPIDSPDKIG
jgi:hypothetical protein